MSNPEEEDSNNKSEQTLLVRLAIIVTALEIVERLLNLIKQFS